MKLILTVCAVAALAVSSKAQDVDFTKDIAPILETSCVKCHGGDKGKGKLKMDTKENFEKGGEHGKLAEAGKKPEESRLIKSILLPEDDDDAMPPKDKGDRVSKENVEKLKKWIAAGAKFPEGVTLKKK